MMQTQQPPLWVITDIYMRLRTFTFTLFFLLCNIHLPQANCVARRACNYNMPDMPVRGPYVCIIVP